MNSQTLAGIAALIRVDASVDPRERTRLLALLRQDSAPTSQTATPLAACGFRDTNARWAYEPMI